MATWVCRCGHRHQDHFSVGDQLCGRYQCECTGLRLIEGAEYKTLNCGSCGHPLDRHHPLVSDSNICGCGIPFCHCRLLDRKLPLGDSALDAIVAIRMADGSIRAFSGKASSVKFDLHTLEPGAHSEVDWKSVTQMDYLPDFPARMGE